MKGMLLIATAAVGVAMTSAMPAAAVTCDSPNVLNSSGQCVTPTQIPTPALLPGLIALGAAAWRKRGAEAESADS